MARSPEIFGKYHLLDKLATGGMAVVYRAKSYGVAGFEKTLVIKKILPNLAADDSFIEMFIDEAKIASALSHINIVQIFDLGEENGEFFIAMEYVDGVDLKTLLDKTAQSGRSFPVNLGAYIITEVAKGLDYAHRRKDGNHRDLNIVHRDVSPHNILISHAGEVKITDFGIARAASRITQTRSGIIRGKFAYMSPEQARGEDIDRRSDVFALGIVLWEMLTGVRLFKAKNDLETLKRVQTLEVQKPSVHNPDVREELNRIVLKALQRDREKRYDSGAEMYEDLSAYLFSIVEKVGPTELSRFLQGILSPPEDERSTDFDHFVSALDELEGEGSAEVFAPEDVSIGASVSGQSLPPSQEPTVSRSVARMREEQEAQEAQDAPDARAAEDEERSESADMWEISESEVDPGTDIGENDRTIAAGDSQPSMDIDLREPNEDDYAAFDREPAVVPLTESVDAVDEGAELAPKPKSLKRGGTQPVVRAPLPTMVRTGEVPFVGRADEVKRLRDLLGHVGRGDGQVIALEGAHGLGKSRLLRELRKLAEDLAVTVYLVRAHSDHPASPYHVVRNALRQVIGAQEGDTLEVLRERIERLAQLNLSETERQLVGALFDVEYIGSPAPELEGRERAQIFAVVFEKILRSLASERPLILMVDDLDHADELSRRAIDHLSSGISEIPMLVLVTAAGSPAALLPHTYEMDEIHEIALPAVSVAATRRLVTAAAGGRDVPDEITDVVVSRSGGNPLQTLMLTRYLMVTGSVELRGETLQMIDQPELPASLDELAQATVGLLSEDHRRVLGTLAAWGIEFHDPLIDGIANAEGDARHAIQELIEAGILVGHRTHVAFAHPVLRSAALQQAGVKREELYRRAAMAVDVVDLEHRRYSPLLCELWIEAGEPTRARPHLQRAANALLREGGGAVLLGSARRLLDAAENDNARLRAALVTAELAFSAQKNDVVWSALDEARRCAEGVERAELELCLKIERISAQQALRSGEPAAAAECLERARQQLVSSASGENSTSSSLQLAREMTRLEVDLASAWREAGELGRSMRRCREALAAAEELREAPLLALCYEELARLHSRREESERAMRNWDQAIGIWKKIGRRRALQGAFEGRGVMELHSDAYTSARNFLRESLELARELSAMEAVSRSLHLLGRVYLRQDNHAQAQANFQESLAIAERFQFDTLVRLNEVYLAGLKAFMGDVQEAIRELEAALARWDHDRPDRFGLLEAEFLLGKAYKMARRVGPTNKHYVRALKLARELNLPRYVREITDEMKEAF